jgi:hypothetical protein
MSEFKSTPSRLARLFRASRDKWKEKALEKQRKLRALEVKVRDLLGSREYWKKRAMAAEKGLSEEDRENLTERKDELQLLKSDEEAEEETEKRSRNAPTKSA